MPLNRHLSMIFINLIGLMKFKRNFLIIIFLLLGEFASAQLTDGCIAPDFDAVDIYGNQYNLYSILDQGKSVVVEFFVSWDTVCWSYQQSHALGDLWESYGPNGSDELFVFLIEVDESTGIECLSGQDGCGDYDWLDGTQYPVINDASIGYGYDISYWPSVFYICPSKRVFQTGTICADNIYSYMSACPLPSGIDYGELIWYNDEVHDFCEELTIIPRATFHNFGTNVITSASFVLYGNDVYIDSLNWDGYLETYQTEIIEFPEWSIYESSMIEIEVETVNNAPVETNNNQLFAFYEAPETMYNELMVRIKTDFFGEETYWEIKDQWGQIYASGGNELVGADGGGGRVGAIGEHAYSSNGIYEVPVYLPTDGCFEFLIVDDYGDGLCCTWGDGFYEVIDAEGNVLFEGGQFYTHENRNFEVLSVTSMGDTNPAGKLMLSPNPVTDLLSISIDVEKYGRWSVLVRDELGRGVDNFFIYLSPSKHDFKIDFSNYDNGVFFITLFNDSNLFSKKVVVSK